MYTPIEYVLTCLLVFFFSFPSGVISAVPAFPHDPYLNPFPVLLTRQSTSNSSTNSTSGTSSSLDTCELQEIRFLRNGTFCATVNNGGLDANTTAVVCPGPVRGRDCHALHVCFLPAGLNKPPPPPPPAGPNLNSTTTDSKPSKCSSSISILTVLAVINIVEAASNLIQGHDRVRSRLGRVRDVLGLPARSLTWTPVSGVLSALSTFLFQVLVSAIGSWVQNRQQFSFAGLLGMWVMRPRGAFPMFALIRLIGWAGFKATVFDAIVTESILDVIALPFTLTFVLTHYDKNSEGARNCGIQGYEGAEEDSRVSLSYASFGWATAAGALSLLVLAQFVIMAFNKRDNLTPEALAEKDEWESYEAEMGWLGRVLRREKRQWVPMIVAMGTFISNWVLWGQFVSLHGTNYCEGSGGVATLAISIVHQIFIPLLRACFGAESEATYR